MPHSAPPAFWLCRPHAKIILPSLGSLVWLLPMHSLLCAVLYEALPGCWFSWQRYTYTELWYNTNIRSVIVCILGTNLRGCITFFSAERSVTQQTEYSTQATYSSTGTYHSAVLVVTTTTTTVCCSNKQQQYTRTRMIARAVIRCDNRTIFSVLYHTAQWRWTNICWWQERSTFNTVPAPTRSRSSHCMHRTWDDTATSSDLPYNVSKRNNLALSCCFYDHQFPKCTFIYHICRDNRQTDSQYSSSK